MKTIVRRTKDEIAAGLSLAQKTRGLTVTDIKEEPKKEQTPEEKYYNGDIIRRTKDEIAGGLTLEEKRFGKSLNEKKDELKSISSSEVSVGHASPTKDDLEKMTDELVPVKIKHVTYKDKKEIDKNQYDWKGKTKVIKEGEIEYIKEVVFVEKGKNKKLVQEIIRNELYKCKREWKKLTMDKDFRGSDLDKLGEKGWTFAFIFSPWIHHVSKDQAKYPDVLYLQREKK